MMITETPLIDWHPEAYQFLLAENYGQVVTCYEQLLEQEPTHLFHYWYLGLAYLLQAEEEQAQLTWFIALHEQGEETFEKHLQDLVTVLDQEAERQETGRNYRLAWLVRGHCRELKPDFLDNLLKLLYLESKIGNTIFDKFEDWQVLELIEGELGATVTEDLWVKVITEILQHPTVGSVSFAQACLKRTKNAPLILKAVIEIAGQKGFDQNYPLYSADLLRACLAQDPNNLLLLKTLFWFYANAYAFQDAFQVANEFISKSPSLVTQLLGNYYHLFVCLSKSDWIQLVTYGEKHIGLLEDFCNSQDLEIEECFVDALMVIAQPLLYLRDKPQENRHLLNQIGKIFQENLLAGAGFQILSFANPLTSNRPLKVGYIGHTLKSHSVGLLSRWLIHYHDPEIVQSHIYSLNLYRDYITEEWFEKKANKFYAIGRNVQAAISQIEADEIDILVDLDSLTFNLTCQVMALKPAPVQVTWLGMDATGIPNIDYFIADPYVLPKEAETYYAEKIWRLPQTYLGIDGFEVGVPTLRREDLGIADDAIIFWNFQSALKRYPDTIRLQLEIIKNVPNSYLFVKGRGDQSVTQQMFKQFAEEVGLNSDRLRFMDLEKTEAAHRANLMLGDVVLDTYPYNGATTTLEVLWTGLPLVTRVGEQFAARNSYGFMMNAGVTEGIAWTDEEYVEWGIKLGTDEKLREQISWKLRQARQTSPLWQGKQFTREMEKAYRQMWEIYLNQTL